MAKARQSKNARSGNKREQAERVQPENDTKDALPKDTIVPLNFRHSIDLSNVDFPTPLCPEIIIILFCIRVFTFSKF